MKPLIIGSRGSPLALIQTRTVMADLKRKWPGRNFEIHILKTQGDRLADDPSVGEQPLGKGLFTGELERALLNREIDLAVHSLKDLPTEDTPGLIVGAIPKRASANDVLITRGETELAELPENPVIATGSPRRAAQLGLARLDVQIAAIRGNIDTRLRKFRENEEWAALVLAAAGLERLKPELGGLKVSPIPLGQMLPAPGQGALAIQTRSDEKDGLELIRTLHDAETATRVTAERMFLHALGGGCEEPIAAHADLEPNNMLRLDGIAWLVGESEPRRGYLIRPVGKPKILGVDLAVELSR